ncbi:MAG: hypothetical protein WC365_10185 [Candidatus Babeliales bacterium]|jgi:hypothetical protein
MGITIRLVDAEFCIKKINQKFALKALKEYAKTSLYTDKEGIDKLRHLNDVFKLFCYYIEYDDDTDDVNDINFEGEKLADDYEMLCSIAPFVEAGSYIEISADENSSWRWFFDGKSCTEIYPTITWKMPGAQP